MNAPFPLLTVKVTGDYACFTRPEFKVERVSYSVMTPSAARGLLEAIFWKPEMEWRVREIHVLKSVRHFSILRNEVNQRSSGKEGFLITEHRAQRHTLALRDVAYRIKADIVLRPHATDAVEKYRDQFRRRVERGQAFHRPYLGCREFAAHFEPDIPGEAPFDLTEDLGLMLFDLDYQLSGVQPRFFNARLVRGVLTVPPHLYETPEAPTSGPDEPSERPAAPEAKEGVAP